MFFLHNFDARTPPLCHGPLLTRQENTAVFAVGPSVTDASMKYARSSSKQPTTVNAWMEQAHCTHVHVLKCNKITCELLAPNLKLFSISNERQLSRENSFATRAHTHTHNQCDSQSPRVTTCTAIEIRFTNKTISTTTTTTSSTNNGKQIGPVKFSFIFTTVWHRIKIVKCSVESFMVGQCDESSHGRHGPT